MNSVKRKAIFLTMIAVLVLSQSFISADDGFNEFAMHIYKKDINGIKELLARGVDVDIREETMGSTPLMVACSLEGTYEIVELLINKGADLDLQGTYDGRSPLMWAAANSQNTVELLLAKGAKVNLVGVDGMTAYIQSIFGVLSSSVTTKVCSLLIAKGANIDAQLTGPDATGWTALMFASSNGHLELVKHLISHKAQVNLKAKDGATALSLAIRSKNDEAVKILKANGASESGE